MTVYGYSVGSYMGPYTDIIYGPPKNPYMCHHIWSHIYGAHIWTFCSYMDLWVVHIGVFRYSVYGHLWVPIYPHVPDLWPSAIIFSCQLMTFWFIYGYPYMDTHICAFIYGLPYMCIHISACQFFLSYVPTFVGLQARVDGIFEFCPLAAWC